MFPVGDVARCPRFNLVNERICMPQIILNENEAIDGALKRFKKECQKSGVLGEVRKRKFYEKPSVRRKRKDEAALRKLRRRLAKQKRRVDRA